MFKKDLVRTLSPPFTKRGITSMQKESEEFFLKAKKKIFTEGSHYWVPLRLKLNKGRTQKIACSNNN